MNYGYMTEDTNIIKLLGLTCALANINKHTLNGGLKSKPNKGRNNF